MIIAHPLRLFLLIILTLIMISCSSGGGSGGGPSEPAPTKYTVIFNDFDNISPALNPVTAVANAVIILPTPVKSDYDFDGWYDGISRVGGSGGSYTVTNNITLTAKWTPHAVPPTQCTAMFYDGTNIISELTITVGCGTQIALPTRNKTGHILEGWYSGIIRIGSPSEIYNLTNDVTLTVKWEPIQYEITFYDNANIIESLTKTVDYGAEIDLPIMSETNYLFEGWQINGIGSVHNDKYIITGNVAFHAKWTIKQYKVTFYDDDNIIETREVDYGTSITLPKPDKNEYIFDGWLLNNTGNTKNDEYSVTSDVNFYAKWTIKQYKVTFYDDDNIVETREVDYKTSITLPKPVKDGYVFDGWLLNNTGKAMHGAYIITSDANLYSKWSKEVWVEISTPVQLNAINDNLSGNYRLVADIDLSSFKATVAPSVEGEWDMIGHSPFMDGYLAFQGKFDGNGYKIKNLKISDSIGNHHGLFAHLEGATITNLFLENVYIVSTSIYSGRAKYVGAIAGKIDNSSITNCNITGSVDGSVGSTYKEPPVSIYTGSIGGMIRNSTITNCYSTASVRGKLWLYSHNVNTGSPHVGGLVGYMSGGTITNSHNTGNISVVGISSSGSSYTGGIVGLLTSGGIIINCSNTGQINANVQLHTGSSLIVAFPSSGGITGYLGDNCAVINSYNSGNVTTTVDASSAAVCYSSSGGISGYVTSGRIMNSYSTGDISVNSSGASSGYGSRYTSYAGGIVGHLLEPSEITNNYSIGVITATNADTSYAGGLVGNTTAYASKVNNNAAINSMIKTEYSGKSYSGRIIVNNTTSIYNNFALSSMSASGIAFVTDVNSYGVDKTEDQLKTYSTYSSAVNGNGLGGLGWKFGEDDDSPWKWVEGSYPKLYWQQ